MILIFLIISVYCLCGFTIANLRNTGQSHDLRSMNFIIIKNLNKLIFFNIKLVKFNNLRINRIKLYWYTCRKSLFHMMNKFAPWIFVSIHNRSSMRSTVIWRAFEDHLKRILSIFTYCHSLTNDKVASFSQ